MDFDERVAEYMVDVIGLDEMSIDISMQRLHAMCTLDFTEVFLNWV